MSELAIPLWSNDQVKVIRHDTERVEPDRLSLKSSDEVADEQLVIIAAVEQPQTADAAIHDVVDETCRSGLSASWHDLGPYKARAEKRDRVAFLISQGDQRVHGRGAQRGNHRRAEA